MDAQSSEIFAELLGTLATRQMNKVTSLLDQGSAEFRVADVIEKAGAENLACPRCRSRKFHRHGQAHGLQRYRCITCSKTFSSITGTPLALLRCTGKWLDYVDCLLMASPAAVGSHRNTSFRWRHRFLTLPKSDRPLRLSGIAETVEIYFVERRGARDLQRDARRRGGAASQRGTSKEQVCVLVARDRIGRTLDFLTGRGPVSRAQLRRCLTSVLDEEVLLVADGNATYRYFARDAGISHQAVNLRKGIRVKCAVHVRNVNAYHSRFREWKARSHGVATHYPPNYLGWRWALDAERIASPEMMLRAAVSVFLLLAVT